MENTKTTNPTKGTDERVKYDDTRTPGCPWWIFGDEDSAKKDLDKAFEITDNEKD